MTPEKIIEAWKATRADETRPAEDKAILKKVYENNLAVNGLSEFTHVFSKYYII